MYNGIVRENWLCKWGNRNVIILCCVVVNTETLELNITVMFLGLVRIFLTFKQQQWTEKNIHTCNTAKYIKDGFMLRNNTLENISLKSLHVFI